jgi:hypothetical protein
MQEEKEEKEGKKTGEKKEEKKEENTGEQGGPRPIKPFRPSHAPSAKQGMDRPPEDLPDGARPCDDIDPSRDREIEIEASEFKRDASAPPRAALVNKSHSLILLNVCHQSQRPRHRYPGFRIIGAFPNMASLRDHVGRNFPEPDASIWMTPAHQLMCVCESTAKQQDAAHNKRRIEGLVRLYADAAAASKADFDKNVARQEGGEAGKSVYSRRKQVREALAKVPEAPGVQESGSPYNLSGAARIAGQNFAVVIALSDIREEVIAGEEPPEPCVSVLGIFDTEEVAVQYAKYTASKEYPGSDLDVVDLYAWHFPDTVDSDAIREVYGGKRLGEIMTARKQNMQTVDEYEDWCRENKVETEVTVL